MRILQCSTRPVAGVERASLVSIPDCKCSRGPAPHCKERCPCAQEYLPLGRFSEAEEAGFAALKAELRGSIQKGIDFVRKGS